MMLGIPSLIQKFRRLRFWIVLKMQIWKVSRSRRHLERVLWKSPWWMIPFLETSKIQVNNKILNFEVASSSWMELNATMLQEKGDTVDPGNSHCIITLVSNVVKIFTQIFVLKSFHIVPRTKTFHFSHSHCFIKSEMPHLIP